jgi:hypothetical protein
MANMDNTARQYDPQPLIEAVTGLDWSEDTVTHALRAIQERILQNNGTVLSDNDAARVLNGLINRNLIRSETDPPATNLAETGTAVSNRKVKYFRVPESER